MAAGSLVWAPLEDHGCMLWPAIVVGEGDGTCNYVSFVGAPGDGRSLQLVYASETRRWMDLEVMESKISKKFTQRRRAAVRLADSMAAEGFMPGVAADIASAAAEEAATLAATSRKKEPPMTALADERSAVPPHQK